jgi:hypothetical protein
MKGFPGFDSLTPGQEVRACMGWGWPEATILEVHELSVLVTLKRDGRVVRVYDIRSIRRQ